MSAYAPLLQIMPPQGAKRTRNLKHIYTNMKNLHQRLCSTEAFAIPRRKTKNPRIYLLEREPHSRRQENEQEAWPIEAPSKRIKRRSAP